jgi:sec-independent protein translocase protein TatC
MSDNLSNGHPEPNPLRLPRVAPPEGQRAARGAYSPETSDEIDDTQWTPEDTEDQVWNDEPTVDLTKPEIDANEVTANELTVADVPSIEDSYESPLGLATSSGSGNGGSGDDGSDGYSSGDDDSSSDYYNPTRRPDTPKDVELGLMEHLSELRVRLLRCALILMAGMAVTWNYATPLQAWFAAPINEVIKGFGKLQILDPTGAFSITVQFSMVSALIITAPLLFWQIWGFIEPALTNTERRYSMVLVPFSSVLFFMGAGLGYAVSPLFFKFFVAFLPTGVAANWDYFQSVVLMAKMLLVFGVMFQVPIVVIFLNKLGVLSRNVLIEYWRHAVVIIFIIVAVLTPTWDPITMTVCATPPCLLYVLSIWLVKWL